MKKNKVQSSFHILLLTAITILIIFSFLILNQEINKALSNFSFSLVLILATLSVKSSRKLLVYSAFAVIIIRLLSNYVIENQFVDSLATIISVLFFLIIVYKLIYQVAKSEDVNSDVILESVNAFLLIGLANSVLAALIYRLDENAYSFSNILPKGLSEFIYYGFITQTTIGYGDISPVSQLAKLHSISFGITGQLYLTIIIAILVGKFLSQKRNN